MVVAWQRLRSLLAKPSPKSHHDVVLVVSTIAIVLNVPPVLITLLWGGSTNALYLFVRELGWLAIAVQMAVVLLRWSLMEIDHKATMAEFRSSHRESLQHMRGFAAMLAQTARTEMRCLKCGYDTLDPMQIAVLQCGRCRLFLDIGEFDLVTPPGL